MDFETFSKYAKAISPIEADEMLIGLTLADYPNLKLDKKKALHRKIKRVRNKAVEREEKALSTMDVANILRNRLGG